MYLKTKKSDFNPVNIWTFYTGALGLANLEIPTTPMERSEPGPADAAGAVVRFLLLK